jgi:hypothetical protein
VIGSGASTIGALVALIAFFALPYLNLPIVGSITGVQVAEGLSSPSSSNASNGSITASHFAVTMWELVVLVAVAGAIALWQIAHRYSTGMRISPWVSLSVLSASLGSLMLLVFQYGSIHSSSQGPDVVLYLGSGFWATGGGVVIAVLGSIIQITA